MGGVRNRESSSRLWPSGVTSMAISTRWDPSPVTRPAHSPSTVARPPSFRPSSEKNEIAASSDSTTIPTLSIRLTVISSRAVLTGNLRRCDWRLLGQLIILHSLELKRRQLQLTRRQRSAAPRYKRCCADKRTSRGLLEHPPTHGLIRDR